ncbi:MAG: hypothetical protein J2P13_00695 [Acidobacteria bacterium]|nr:hypothetical protein [Acidobacteriota bacterium]
MKFEVVGLLLLGGIGWAQVPQSRHVWTITEENHSYETVIGNPAMPYYNSLAAKYGLANQYYAEQHNSLSALMWLVAGQPVTSNDGTTACYNVNNVARQLISQGYSWRSYQEDLPYPGFAGLSSANYVRRHNPIIDFTDTCASGQAANSVPYTELETDIRNHATPNYAYISPNLSNDAHNGTLAAADVWLSHEVPAILALPEFQPGGDGILFIVWDEADLSSGSAQDNRCTATIPSGCGGRLATLVIGPQVKPGFKSTIRYDHANLLRTVCDAMAFTSCPGAGAVASPMTDFFNTVSISTPFPNATVTSPLHIQATTSDASPVIAMQVYVDDALKYQASQSALNASVAMTAGRHHVVVQSWDSRGGIHKRGLYVVVRPEAVQITNPAPASVVGPSVRLSATAGGAQAVTKMQLYLDGNPQSIVTGHALSSSIKLTEGSHTIAVEATEQSGGLVRSQVSLTSASPAVNIVSPHPNAQLITPVFVSATTIDPTPVVAAQIYVDNQLAYQVSGTGVQASLSLPVGQHLIVVQEWNSSGATYRKGLTVNVLPVPITILAPASNATVSSPVTIKASAPGSSPVETMQIYIDNALAYSSSGQSIQKAFNLAPGRHYIVAKGWDDSNDNWYSGEYITVQ